MDAARSLLGVQDIQAIRDSLQKGEIDACGYSDATHTHNLYYNVVRDADAKTQLDFIDYRRAYSLADSAPYDARLGDASVAADDYPGSGQSRTRIYVARGVYGAYVVVTVPTDGKTPAETLMQLLLSKIG
ncbi:hypothetical protein [Leifsonia sp.]|uniref:hypothetical protein n=1 Tax=unclassified Leifsonia TaxID=2663824 RepID=UPI003704505D